MQSILALLRVMTSSLVTAPPYLKCSEPWLSYAKSSQWVNIKQNSLTQLSSSLIRRYFKHNITGPTSIAFRHGVAYSAALFRRPTCRAVRLRCRPKRSSSFKHPAAIFAVRFPGPAAYNIEPDVRRQRALSWATLRSTPRECTS